MADAPAHDRDAVTWGIASHGEPRWPALLAVLVAAALQVILPETVIRGLGNRALIPALEVGLIIVLLIVNPGQISEEESRLRLVGVTLIALITVANTVSLGELIQTLLYGSNAAGRPLMYTSVPIWLTNVIVFGLWYWELDRGGPAPASKPGIVGPTSSFRRCRRRGRLPVGRRASWTISTRRSPTQQRSARPTRCR